MEAVDLVTLEALWRTYDLVGLARVMNDLAQTKTVLEEKLKEVNQQYDSIRMRVIPDMMADEGITNITIKGIGRITITPDVFASIVKDKQDEAYQWLADHGMGDCIQETVNASTLKALVRRMLRDPDAPEIPEHLFKITPYSRASITKT